MYFENNLVSLMNLLKCVDSFNVPYFVFFLFLYRIWLPRCNSCYRNNCHQTGRIALRCYQTNGRQIISEFSRATGAKSILLRYFNPAGAHPSGLIGELPMRQTSKLGARDHAKRYREITRHYRVWRQVSNKRWFVASRDFIHVGDLAHAHTLALQYLIDGKLKGTTDIFNLHLEPALRYWKPLKPSKKQQAYHLTTKLVLTDTGDVVAIYANNDKSKNLLGWDPAYSLEDILQTAWKWEQKLKEDEKMFTGKNITLN